RILSDAVNIISEGEVLQLMNCHNADVDEERYLRVIRYKTAKLFEAASQIGALIGGADADTERRLADYGSHLGAAFQLIDDALDYSGAEAETGKRLGDDLAEGKPTLPLIHAMQRGTPAQAGCVRRAIENGGREDFAEVMAAIRATGALEHTRAQAEAEAERARASIETLPASPHKDSLLKLAVFAVARTF
ncbi:MAG: polyprenyl synthetase family protein, partial [Candidatus Accumulibacter sp.]|nr:polyprenyl synthetase family protein [Accumulibacter sp.]